MQVQQRAPVSEFRERIRWMTLVVFTGFLVLLSRMVHLQIVEHGRWSGEAEGNIHRRIFLPSTRGVLRDARGRVIAANGPSYNVYVVPYLFLRRINEVFPRFAEYLGLGREERERLEARLRQAEGNRRFQQLLVREGVDRETLAILETHRDELPGVSVVAAPVRTYPFGELASHAIGFLNEVSAEDLEAHPEEDYRAGDRMGRSGLERAWESILRGRRGWVRVDRDNRGVILSSREEIASFGPDRRQEPVPGRDLVLTLDMELMRAVERAFQRFHHPSGSAAVVDVHTGRVLALYSRPSIDPNALTRGLTLQEARALQDNPFHPQIDKSIYEVYPPGSTVKPFTALAGLSAGLIDPRERINCQNTYTVGRRVFHCAHQAHHGLVNLYDAIFRSCNVYFFTHTLDRRRPDGQLAHRGIGLDLIAQMAMEFGLGRRTGIGINSEAPGFVPTRAWYDRQHAFRLGFALNTAIGQGSTRSTVLQLALSYAALANGGQLFVPQLVERVEGPDGAVLERFPPTLRRRIALNPAHLEMVNHGLRGVVEERGGTAHYPIYNVPDSQRAEIAALEIAGKTGTAQVSRLRRLPDGSAPVELNLRDHAWFAAFAPASAPEVAIVVFVEHGGGGGSEAAPVAREILRSYFTRVRPGAPLPGLLRAQQNRAQAGH